MVRAGDGWARIIDSAAIGQARCSQVERDVKSAHRLQPVSMNAHDHFRHAAQPAEPAADRGDLSGAEVGTQWRPNAVGAGITAGGGADVETVKRCVATRGVEGGLDMSTRGEPIPKA